MRVTFFSIFPLEFGGGLEKYYIETTANLRKQYPALDIKIVTFDTRVLKRVLLIHSLYFFKKHSVESSLRETSEAVQKQLDGVTYVQVKNIRALRKQLAASDVIYSKNEVMEAAVLKRIGYKYLPPIVMGCATAFYYPTAKSLSSKLHNFLYNGRIYKFLTRGVSRFHVKNSYDETHLQKLFPDTEIVKIYNPVHAANFVQTTDLKVKIDKRVCNIVWTGRITEQKGIDDLCEIIERINATQEKSVHWYVAGAGYDQAKVEALAKKWKNVSYLGHVDSGAIPGLLAKCDLFLCTSKWETFGNSIVEALYAGIPAISYAIPGPVDIIDSGKTGLLVSSIDDFTDAVRGFVEGKYSFENTREAVLAKFDPTKTYQKFYTKLLRPYIRHDDASPKPTRSRSASRLKILSDPWLLVGLGIFFTFHLMSLLQTGWLADEIFHVHFINDWFLTHFREYFFQFQQHNYPPRSPVFGNPPLAMWLMTGGMAIASVFHVNELFGARAVNMVFGLASLILVYVIARHVSGKRAGQIAVVLFATFPAMIVTDTTAYLDAVFITLLLLFFYLLLKFVETQKTKYFFISAMVCGLAFIAKYQFFVLLLPTLIYFYPRTRRYIRRRLYILYFLIIALTASAMWAGLRDPHQIKSIITSVTGFTFGQVSQSSGLFSDYSGLDGGTLHDWFYYFFMLLCKTPLILLGGVVCAAVFHRQYEADEKYHAKLLAVGLIVPIVFFGIIGGVPSTVHRMAMVFPFLILLSALGYDLLIRRFSQRTWVHWVVIGAVTVLAVIPLITTPAQYYNFYTNALNKVVNHSGGQFRNGDGEGMLAAAQYLRQDGRIKLVTRIGVVRFRYVLAEYLPNADLEDVPLDKGCDYILTQGLDYVVIHESHMTGGVTPYVLQDGEKCLSEQKVIMDAGKPIVHIYKVVRPTDFTRSEPLFADLRTVSFNSRSKASSLALGSDNQMLTLAYAIKEHDWAYGISQTPKLAPYTFDYLYVDVTSKAHDMNMYVDLLSSTSDNFYYRAKIQLNFTGEKKFYIPLGEFAPVQHGKVEPSLGKISAVKLSVDSPYSSQKGTLKVDSLSLVGKR